ncbi:MAG TPA: Fic family protein [Mycobacteriales bacterium]|nr:Fic family protein [Mycobacteriales bacterium]
MGRHYERTHPWISFALDLRSLDHLTWMRLGEAVSKCEHIEGVPLRPAIAEDLNEIFLTKGVHATTQIEGNTLSEEQVRRRVRHDLPLPPSQEYLGREVDNIVEACNGVVEEVRSRVPLEITPDRITRFNALVLRDLPLNEGVRPGTTRQDSVLVGSDYRGAPAEDCEYLLDRLCRWLTEMRSAADDRMRKPVAILSAIMAHLYLAWIHPFGDGNGRTARLMEFQILVQSGIPLPSAHLLSDFYNQTRSEYYRQLALSSREPYRVERFIGYALEGFVDGLRSQIDRIRAQQMDVTWENYVHSAFHDRKTAAAHRQRLLALSLPPNTLTPLADIPTLTPLLAAEYAGSTRKMVTRDVNTLWRMKLAIGNGATGVLPLTQRIEAFRPLTADPT